MSFGTPARDGPRSVRVRRTRPSGRSYATPAGVLAALVLGGAFAWARYGGAVERRVRALLRLSTIVPLSDLRVCRCAPDRTVTLERDDGLRLVGSLYDATGAGVRTGVLLVHGDVAAGRRLPLYGTLAAGLAERGVTVLTIDLTGYGESADPFGLGSPDALERSSDVHAALDFLAGLPHVEDGRVHVIGHSLGAVPVLDAAIGDARVASIVAIGPPRRWTHRMDDPDDRTYFWRRAQRIHRQVYGRPLPGWYTEGLWLERMRRADPSRHLDVLSTPCHPPLLLVDGERESDADRRYLAGFADRVAEPKAYVTLPRADHYANTTDLFWTVYDGEVMRELIDRIDRWMEASRRTPPTCAERGEGADGGAAGRRR